LAKEYLRFEQAQGFTRKLGLRSVGEWKEYCKSGKKPEEIPSNPNKAYRQKWKSWGHWLGTGNVANVYRTYKPFEEAREFVRSLGLKNQKQWSEYSKSGKKPP
jgi:hypothetical protein